MHVLSSEQFTPEMLGDIFMLADEFRDEVADPEARHELARLHEDEFLVNLFYAASTRTRLSFDFAAQRLGMNVVGTENAEQFSSAAKGETLEHSIKVLAEYGPSVIVLRHKATGAAVEAAEVSNVPIFNAGDGNGEHPTQALLDAHTIYSERQTLSGLHVVFGGDLARGRTARSLAKVLSMYPDNRYTFTSTPELAMRADIKELLDERGVPYAESDDPEETFADADVVYWTRLQKERPLDEPGPDGQPVMIEEQDPRFILGKTALDILPEDSMIMHPMPIDGEIDPIVDADPRARYFRQAGNGMYVRMALIHLVLNEAFAS